ncbi:MAG: oxidase [Planctomycetes bacterium]|nr:oxidase [Planctomycetota bacterium]
MNEHSNAAPSKASYLVIYLMIASLIFVAIGVSFMNLGSASVYANLIVAATQASLLAYFFMHLKGADKLTWLIAGAGLFWIFIMFLLLLTDYLTRHIAAY